MGPEMRTELACLRTNKKASVVATKRVVKAQLGGWQDQCMYIGNEHLSTDKHLFIITFVPSLLLYVFNTLEA
jgi:hypothetical protein